MEINQRFWARLILFSAAAIAAFAFLSSVGDLVRILVISGLLAYVLDPVVTRIESLSVERLPATVMLFLGLILLFGGFLALLMPIISEEIAAISASVDPEESRKLIERLDTNFRELLDFIGMPDLNITSTITASIGEYAISFFSNILQFVSIVTNLIIIPFAVFFILKDMRSIRKQFVSLVPNRYFEPTCNVIYKIDMQLGNYLRGQVLDALIIGLLSMTALLLLDVRYAIFIGAFAGLANLIPYIGPLCGAVLAAVASIADGGDPWMIPTILGAFAAIQLVDNVIVQPAIVARRVSLPPLVVLLVVIIGGRFFGVLGMLLSVPVTAIIKVIYEEGVRVFRQYRLT